MNSAPASTLPTGGPVSVAVIILTYNEARHIERAIASVRCFAEDILVVDSFSTDDTVTRAEAAGARVMQHPFVNQARQFQWALEHGGTRADWTLRLDADEVIEPDLAARIARELPTTDGDVVGVNFDRKHVFMGRWIRHGGRYPLRLLRLWRRGAGRVEDRWMDEHVLVEGGRVVTMAGGFADVNLHDLTFFTDKHNKYATREAIEILNRHHGLFDRTELMSRRSASRQASTKRWFKERVYYRLPFWVGPLGYFLYRYLLQLGFLDGREGFIYHFLQAFWYRLLVNAKTIELEREIAQCGTREACLARLSDLTGHRLGER